MIRTGQKVENPVTGEELIFHKTSRDTGGEYVLVETILRPDAFVAAAHSHPYQSESFQVLEGRVGFKVGRKKVELGAGDAVTVLPRTAHKFWNASETAAIFRRGAYAAGCWVQGGKTDWLIEHVASLPMYRGRGLVQALINHALSTGKAAGFERASISFLIGNEAAQRCYAKAGFAFAEEKRDFDFEAITSASGFRRFERRI